ncbi:MAG: putative 2-aminoethylphosphonate ABC transporter substrate-binding protein [Thauera sp.]
MTLKRLAQSLAALGLALSVSIPAHAENTVLNVYTALETDQLKAYQEAFNKQHPDIEIKWTRDSTGIITAKLLAEKSKPVADVIMGVAASSMVVFDRENMLQPYAPQNLKEINPKFRDAANPPKWVGMDVWGAAICYNVAEMQKQGLPRIESWKDLLKPEFKGKVVMPNPNSSGTGFLDVTAWLQMFGEKGGWEYMDKLHDNVAVYTHSGSKPCVMAGAGEFPVGISFEYRANTVREKGAPIDVIFPSEGLGWDVEAIAIVKDTPRLEAARKLADWAATREANELYAKNFAVVAIPGIATRLKHVPSDYEQRLVKNDFAWMAQNRDAILAEWQKRYANKSEAKK